MDDFLDKWDKQLIAERRVFEEWLPTQSKAKEQGFSSPRWGFEGYEDKIINALWIGFHAGRELKGKEELGE